jgi:hypothetical protein
MVLACAAQVLEDCNGKEVTGTGRFYRLNWASVAGCPPFRCRAKQRTRLIIATAITRTEARGLPSAPLPGCAVRQGSSRSSARRSGSRCALPAVAPLHTGLASLLLASMDAGEAAGERKPPSAAADMGPEYSIFVGGESKLPGLAPSLPSSALGCVAGACACHRPRHRRCFADTGSSGRRALKVSTGSTVRRPSMRAADLAPEVNDYLLHSTFQVHARARAHGSCHSCSRRCAQPTAI